ncbi:MAG TPA: DUF2188 domain-containing protein [Candidatus Melainabacteria bacterium]|jgi:hypothetical protein|nr:DUF2188 domain-containing protein [Candidatus Melainabacteria bacterium]HIN66931.1 DUF2188 domain-containing protein [Candidatus Obscuribacterales bacterium]
MHDFQNRFQTEVRQNISTIVIKITRIGTLDGNLCPISGNTEGKQTMKNNELHVVPTPEGWQITPPPEHSEDETFDTRTEAVMAALHAAEIENLDVVVHSDDGTIVEMPLKLDNECNSAAA